MPTSLNARFDADFSQLQKAVDGADVHLQTFEKAANRASAEVGKLASSFRGDALIRDATLAAKAVEAIGGSARLSATEQQKLLTTTTAAIDALKRQGAEIPPGIAKIAAELKGVNDVGHLSQAVGVLKELGSTAGPAGTAIEGVTSKFTSLGATAGALGPVGIAIAGIAAAAAGLVTVGVLAADTLVGLVKHAADAGDEMLTLSNKTGVSVDALSEFKYIGDQTGVSLESITDAAFKLSTNLGKAGKDTKLAIKDIGLSFDQLRASSPEDAFKAIVSALGQVGDTARQQADGVALFGKGYKEVSALTKEDIGSLISRFHDLGGGVTSEMAIAGDAVNDALSDINTAFEATKLKIGAVFLPSVASALSIFTDAWIQASKTAGLSYVGLADTIDKVTAVVLQLIGATIASVADLLKSFVTVGKGMEDFGGKLRYVIPDFGESALGGRPLASGCAS
jgi:hypothetical protein